MTSFVVYVDTEHFGFIKRQKKVGNLGLKLVAGQIKTTANKRFYVSRADGSSLSTFVFSI